MLTSSLHRSDNRSETAKSSAEPRESSKAARNEAGKHLATSRNHKGLPQKERSFRDVLQGVPRQNRPAPERLGSIESLLLGAGESRDLHERASRFVTITTTHHEQMRENKITQQGVAASAHDLHLSNNRKRFDTNSSTSSEHASVQRVAFDNAGAQVASSAAGAAAPNDAFREIAEQVVQRIRVHAEGGNRSEVHLDLRGASTGDQVNVRVRLERGSLQIELRSDDHTVNLDAWETRLRNEFARRNVRIDDLIVS